MRNTRIQVRILCLLLCLAVLAPCASALGETTKVAAYLLRLRESPSSTGKVLDAYLDGKSYQEIAAMQGRHVKSIDNALQRVKRKLERLIEERD